MLAKSVSAFVFGCFLLLTGCGGSGGGSDPSGNSGKPVAGSFTLSTNTITFTAFQDRAVPQSQTISFTLNDNVSKDIAKRFSGAAPSWLDVSFSGSAPNFTVTLTVLSTAMDAKTYNATLQLATGDASLNVLSTQSVNITYNLLPSIKVSTAQPVFNAVYGSSVTTDAMSLGIVADNVSWTVTSSDSWLSTVTGTQQGSKSIELAADFTTLPVGSSSATLIFQDVNNAGDVFSMPVTVNVLPPDPIVKVSASQISSLTLGGTDGLGGFTQEINLSVETGTASYPWSLSISDSQSLGWLKANAASGLVSGDIPASIGLSADLSGLHPDSYTATIQFSVVVKGQTFSTQLPVQLNWESHRLVVYQNGVALSSVPGRQILQKDLLVSSSRGKLGVPWSAKSDQPWLNVTPSGTTGSKMTLVANPAGLAVNQEYVANVQLSTTDSSIEKSDTIRVGLWVSDADPQNLDVPIRLSRTIATNPVEPFLYSADDAGHILVFNVYTGQLVSTFSGLFLMPAAMTTSSDGKLLFVGDSSTPDTYVLDAITGSLLATYPKNPNYVDQVSGLFYARPNGIPVLWTSYADIVDLESGSPIQLTQQNIPYYPPGLPASHVTSPDGQLLFSGEGPGTRRFKLVVTALGGRSMDMQELNGVSNYYPVCVTSSTTGLVTIGGNIFSPTLFDFVSTEMNPLSVLRVPTETGGGTATEAGIVCGKNQRVYVALGKGYLSMFVNNLSVFDDHGNQIGSADVAPINYTILDDQFRLSGDETRAATVVAHDGIVSISLYDLSM
ncbi:MAG TPA: hypothetical protein VG962_05500 [Steroidobacteraceae bacterium]|nr:hypothetical protein [Steroidobacteraceae bacterium]